MTISRVCCSEHSPFSTPTKAAISIISLALIIIGGLALYGSFQPTSMLGPLGHQFTKLGSSVIIGAGLIIFIFNVLHKAPPVDASSKSSRSHNPPTESNNHNNISQTKPIPTGRGIGAPGESIGAKSPVYPQVQTESVEQNFEDQF